VKKISGVRDTAKWHNGMTPKAVRKITERAESLVSQSHNLIETTTLLIGEARQLIVQTKAKKHSRYVKSERLALSDKLS
jgi:hypothetical protein